LCVYGLFSIVFLNVCKFFFLRFSTQDNTWIRRTVEEEKKMNKQLMRKKSDYNQHTHTDDEEEEEKREREEKKVDIDERIKI